MTIRSKKLAVSACLLGRPCRYDGGSKRSDAITELVARVRASGGAVVAVCPEELGGLGTPRPAADLRGGDGDAVLSGHAKVRTVGADRDVTQAFVDGAEAAAQLADGCDQAVLKARSPSCGVGRTHVDGEVAPGDGVFAALLRRRGVALWTDEQLT